MGFREAKSGFDFSYVSSHSRIVNANRLRVHMLAYNLFNWFRRLVLSVKMRKLRIDAIRLKLLKIAARAVHSAGYITFKLCSSCPYKEEFFETLANIRALKPVHCWNSNSYRRLCRHKRTLIFESVICIFDRWISAPIFMLIKRFQKSRFDFLRISCVGLGNPNLDE